MTSVKPFSFQFGGYQNPASIHNQSAALFGRELGKKLGDAVEFHLEGNITNLGHQTGDLVPLTESGELTFCYMSTSYFSDKLPPAGVLDLPFIIKDRKTAYAALDGVLGDRLKEIIQAENPNLRLLAYWDNGFRHFSNRVRPIRTPADCKGIRIRTLPSELHGRAYRLLGFDPVALNIMTFVKQIATGDIDAQDNPLTNIYNFGMHKHHRYITLSGHIFGSVALLCNAKAYDAWPVEVRQAVLEATDVATTAQRQMAESEDTDVLKKLNPEENEVIHLSKSEREQFVEATRPILEQQRALIGEDIVSLL
ncbi:TRAP transporter substrate-binding protein [Thermodesulfobacteriota bacterium]